MEQSRKGCEVGKSDEKQCRGQTKNGTSVKELFETMREQHQRGHFHRIGEDDADDFLASE